MQSQLTKFETSERFCLFYFFLFDSLKEFVLVWLAAMVDLVENVTEIAKITNYHGRSELVMTCALRRLVSMPKISAEIAVKSTGFREIVGV